MGIIIRMGGETSVEDIRRLMRLDIESYGPSIETNPGLDEARYLKCPDILIVALDGDRLIGGSTAYPVRRSLYEDALRLRRVVDDDLSPNDILPFEKGVASYVLGMDVVVDPEYRGRGVAKMLQHRSREFFREKILAGYPIERMFGFAFSGAGMRVTVDALGAREVWREENGVVMFEITGRELAEKPYWL